MKVKSHNPEYEEWKTENQWKKLGYEVIDKTKYEEMWPTQSHCQYRSKFFKYFGPDNVQARIKKECSNCRHNIFIVELVPCVDCVNCNLWEDINDCKKSRRKR